MSIKLAGSTSLAKLRCAVTAVESRCKTLVYGVVNDMLIILAKSYNVWRILTVFYYLYHAFQLRAYHTSLLESFFWKELPNCHRILNFPISEQSTYTYQQLKILIWRMVGISLNDISSTFETYILIAVETTWNYFVILFDLFFMYLNLLILFTKLYK